MGVWIVIPMYRVHTHIERVLSKVPSWVAGVVAVDDRCPDGSAALVRRVRTPTEVHVVCHDENQGVGGAVLTGYAEAIARGARIIVKVDGDDQMDLQWLAHLALPIASGQADYAKGNRFSSISHVSRMPRLRLFGNALLSLASKISSGYWPIFDPTNGFTAIDARVAEELLSRDVSRRYFFESDVLYHLGSLRAVVVDVPMPAIYEDEESNLSVRKVVLPFALGHLRNLAKRFVGQYVVRNFTVATVEAIVGVSAIAFGLTVAATHFATKSSPEETASAGVVMLFGLPIILGVQLLLAAVNFDVPNVPSRPIHP